MPAILDAPGRESPEVHQRIRMLVACELFVCHENLEIEFQIPGRDSLRLTFRGKGSTC